MKHNSFNEERSFHSAVTTQTATFLFRGLTSRRKFSDAGIQDISTRIKVSVKVHNEIKWSDMNLEIVRWVNDFRWVKGV